jgi:hypoxanthine phosphoribosyltransferase
LESLPPELDSVMLTQEQIRTRVSELAAAVSADYAGRDLLAVGVLKGSFIFMADLLRQLTVPATVDFMAVSSYGDGTTSSGKVRIMKDLDEPVENRDVLFVEDIIDTGATLLYLTDNLRTRGAASVRICALLDKPSRRAVPLRADYVGFTIPDAFVVGYGLDYAQRYRGLPFVAVLKADLCESAARAQR